MDYEVELKFRTQNAADVTSRLTELGATAADPVVQRDAYFNHPSRDFAQTDEAFRIRCIGEANRLTYKGPLVDRQTKTRQEVEVGCEAGAGGRDKLRQMLVALGFREVREVVKRRTACHLDWQGRAVEAAIDDVDGLGLFVELETIAAAENWEPARDALQQLALTLKLHDSERRSYLQLLIESAAPDQCSR